MGADGGINDWYLDREGRGVGPCSEDDQPDRGPDTWLDQLTVSAGQRDAEPRPGGPRRGVKVGRAGATGKGPDRTSTLGLSTPFPAKIDRPPALSERPVSPEATMRGRKVQRTSERNALPSPQNPRMMPEQPSAHDQMLVRAAKMLQKEAKKELSYLQVVQGLQRAGISVSKRRLRQAFHATGAAWGKPSAKAKPAQPRAATTGAATTKKLPTPGRPPRAHIVEGVRRLRAARPDLSPSEVAHQLRASGLRVADAEVTLAMAMVQLGGRRRARPTPHDQALAHEASLICARSSVTLALDEVEKRLHAAGWNVSVADIDYALVATKTRLPRPSGGLQTVGAVELHGVAAPSLLEIETDADSPGVCQACGSSVSANGYCGCS